ncbi:MAG: glycosyltransferase family 8 protein [Pseudomonadota bacterium]|nr:glycosyltransferase family 8 protein [Pseudomonadota bacterium]
MDGIQVSRAAYSRHAYVTLVTNSNYVAGARALLRSLLWTGTEADLVVMHTAALSADDLAELETFAARLVQVDLLPTSDAFNQAHARDALHGAAPFTKGGKPVFHTPLDNFAKLRLWQLTDYDRVVFLDADTVVVRNIDNLFEYPEFCAAPNVYESLSDFHRMNSGVFTARPSQKTFHKMLAELDVPDAFWRRTDQTFLQSFFPDWNGLPVTYNMLQYVWMNLPDLWDWDMVKIIHYQYEKPWEMDHPKSEELATLIAIWHQYYDGSSRPDLERMTKPVAIS